MTNEENIALVAKYRAALAEGDARKARRVADDIVRANLGLINRLAIRFARPQSKDDLKDATQAGMMGVLRAIRDFDPTLGSFSTHAGNHIRDYVQRWSGKTIAVVRPRSATMPASIARAAAKFRMTHGREPTATDLGITEQQLTEWSSATHIVALDDWDDESPRTELTYDDNEAEHQQQKLRVEAAWDAAMQELSPRNREIAESFFLDGKNASEIGAAYGLSHGRVVQVTKRIETRLRRAIDPDYEPTSDYADEERDRIAARERVRKWRARRALAAGSPPPPSSERAA